MEDNAKLTIPLETVCFIIGKARQFDAKDEVTEPDPGSNASDDDMRAVLEDHSDDPVALELISVIRGLNEDEQADLVALAWYGRDGGTFDSWDEARAAAAAAHNERTATYLLGIPLLADYLEAGLEGFGLSCGDVGEG
ncbi:DUF3775 domain-containing protein [Acidocella sp.]|uniref:DUF3775 domain-containing protein n=1 Tax=Acidocella sp. TaxID=50710 RepID=UPI002633975C|nr:DUF3775 domain-containing protein [Acidocella sp.]